MSAPLYHNHGSLEVQRVAYTAETDVRELGIQACWLKKIMFLEMLATTFSDINHRSLHIRTRNTDEELSTANYLYPIIIRTVTNILYRVHK